MLASETTLPDSAMNDPNSPFRDDAGQRKQEGAPVSVGRRRFAKGVAPVVLGTLASKPVLGAEYICTVSGHASGNASAHLTNDAVCDVGDGINFWRNDGWSDLPAPLNNKGTLPTPITTTTPKTCDFGTGQGTLFNGLVLDGQTLSPTFFYSIPDNDCVVNQNSSRPAASLYQVLARTGGGEIFQLGRVTVASLLNAAKYPNYPVSQGRIIKMFNAVKDGETYYVDGANLNLTRSGVIEYLQKLYS